MSEPTIDELKALQRRLNLLDVHVCWIGEERFVVAHTDEERATIDLEACELHVWLVDQDEPPEDVGYYVVTPHEVDAYSEPYPVERFDFTPLDIEPADRPPGGPLDGPSPSPSEPTTHKHQPHHSHPEENL